MTHILSLSYGKDSLACLEACKILGYPIDHVMHAEVWATDTIQADLPPMVEFKEKADKIIKNRYGLTVEHVYAKDINGEKLSYDKYFYSSRNSKVYGRCIYGFPMLMGSWCVDRLKTRVINKALKTYSPTVTSTSNVVQYLGIAADEHDRIGRHTKSGVVMPLVDIGWDEAHCRQWCEDNDLLSPIYTNATRGGCWFCHKQSVNQLRVLRKNYPELWKLLLQWDLDSPAPFKPDGHTVHDYDRRFCLEDLGCIPKNKKFKWKMLEKIPASKEEDCNVL